MSSNNRIEGVRQALAERAGERVVVAWSGGLDSTVLLDLARRAGLDVHAVHVDHQMRATSGRDSAFCAKQARRWGVPLSIERLDVRGAGSSQERARLQRYAALVKCARASGCSVVMTAHHGQDALETALLNRERNAGLVGVTSLMRDQDRGPVPAWPAGLKLDRPLLTLLRRDIEAYARAHELQWTDDPTNAARDYRRNALRQDIAAGLADERDARVWLDALDDLAVTADEQLREVDQMVRRWSLEPVDADTHAMRVDAASDCDPDLRAQALLRFARRTPCSISGVHLESLERAIAHRKATRISIRGGRATVDHGLLVIERARARGGRDLDERAAPPLNIALDQPGAVRWFDTTLIVREIEAAEAPETAFRAVNCELSGGASTLGPHSDNRRIPGPLRWRWPQLVREGCSWTVGREPIYAQRPDGAYVGLEWHFEPRTAWHHVVFGVERSVESSIRDDESPRAGMPP